VIIGQRTLGCCRSNECGRIEARPIQAFQSVYQARQERILDQVRDLFHEEVPPLLILRDVGCYELLVKSVLPGPGEKAWLYGSGWPEVSWLNLHGSAPHLCLGDQVSRRQETPFDHPRRRISSLRCSDLISEIDDQSGSSGEVGSPVRIVGDSVGQAW
jgi:hypothetical protein